MPISDRARGGCTGAEDRFSYSEEAPGTQQEPRRARAGGADLAFAQQLGYWSNGLNITRAAFTGGCSSYSYVSALGTHLFLSADPNDVRMALDAGCAAATILPLGGLSGRDEAQQLRITFDGDAVLFSDEAEQVYRRHGLEVFNASERAAAHEPLREGPFKDFLATLHEIQSLFSVDDSPLCTALITARRAPSHERIIRTLQAWGIPNRRVPVSRRSRQGTLSQGIQCRFLLRRPTHILRCCRYPGGDGPRATRRRQRILMHWL